MKQVICCDEGSEDMRSEVRRGAELKVQKPDVDRDVPELNRK